MPLLSVQKLGKNYKDVRALSNISFDMQQGELVSVIGRSGAGKSTLLRCINRMIEPSSGNIVFEDTNVCALKRRELRRVRSRMGMVFQHYNLVYRQTVLENVLHGRLGYKNDLQGMLGLYTEDEKVRALEILAMLGLEDQTWKRCDTLSGGQKQRVGIARALVQEPRLILCDEPIASLDPSSAKIIMDHLRRISHDMGITVLINLHQVDVAVKYSDRVLGIRAGDLVFEGKPDKLGKKDIHHIYGTDHGDLISD